MHPSEPIAARLAPFAPLPTIWGEGALFAFSGLDGETNTASQFVGSLTEERYGLLWHTPRRRLLRIELSAPHRPLAVTGDVVLAKGQGGELVLAWSAWHTLAGAAPEGTAIELGFEDHAPVERQDHLTVAVDPGRDVLVLARRGTRFALAYGASVVQARQRAAAGLQADLTVELEKRLDFYRKLPLLGDLERDRLLRKCASVMKVNTLSCEGANRFVWSTPDRVPHRHMWLWDSVFHSFAMNRIAPRTACSFLQAVLDRQQENGMIPHMMPAHEPVSRITQPPILAWGVWENFRRTEDHRDLAWALPRLEAYLEWNLEHRDRNRNGLLEWHIEGNVRCRSGESGLDNSPRFDQAVTLDAVDFSAFQACDMGCTAKIAATLGEAQKAAKWQQRATAMATQLHRKLWQDGFYYDCDVAGDHTGVKAVSGFLPLLLDDIPADRVDALLGQLRHPDSFGAPFPVPSVSLDNPAWSTDMWRGATWLNLNYAIVEGLRRQGCGKAAAELVQQTLTHAEKYYKRYGVLFEFFDAQDRIPPPHCDRKGPCLGSYDIRAKVDSIRDYHWTAAVVACLLLDPPG